jgi:hypothetical protein
MKHQDGETEDVPFFKNDMKDAPTTTGKALDPADGPGKADAEMGDPEFSDTGLNEEQIAALRAAKIKRPIALF